MNRTRRHVESFAQTEISAGAAVRGERGAAHGSTAVRDLTRWLFAVWGLVGVLCVVLGFAVGAEVVASSGRSPSHPAYDLAVASAGASAEMADRTTEARQLPRDGRDRPSDEAEATLQSESEDDEDARSHACTPAPLSRSPWGSSGRGTALRSGPVADTGHSLVSTGLARGPPRAT